MISEEYKELNRKLHENPDYGTSGRFYVEKVRGFGIKDILDYGCGKGTLEAGLGWKIKNYDPVTNPERPEPADLVVCTDVLEHIEPEYLDAVLEDLRSLTKGVGYFVLNTGKAKKYLEDGRNAHLIQEGKEWWVGRIEKFFKVVECIEHKNGLEVYVE